MKEDPYYLGNMDCPPTKLTIQTGTVSVSLELPWDAGMDELLDAFYTACIGISFHPDSVVEAMKDFVEQRLPNNEEYEQE